MAVVSALFVSALAAGSTNMNGRPYLIANPNGDGFSGDFAEINNASYGSNQWFDVYSPVISTVYGQVYWDIMDPVPLPTEIVKQFDGKVMAITGYETDQVFRRPGGDVSVPITAAYNHHYSGYFLGKGAKLVNKKVDHPEREGHMLPDGTVHTVIGGDGSAVLHEGNGGEFRLSYHGYPKGWGQLVSSPVSFRFSPMQIDTWNRDNKNFDGFWPGPEPMNSESPPNAPYSGLLECPCTTRMSKENTGTESARGAGVCATSVTQNQCAAAAKSVAPETVLKIVSETGRNASLPPGCTLLLSSQRNGGSPAPTAIAFYNEESTGVPCGGTAGTPTKMFGALSPRGTGVADLGLWLELDSDTFQVVITGPANVWFGVGFNATTMAGTPYTIVVDGDGHVTERALGDHAAGTLLPSTLTVKSSSVSGGRRTVTLSRPIAATPAFQFSLDTLRTNPQLHIIAATGSGKAFGYHQAKSASTMNLALVDAPTCVCADGADVPFGKGVGYLVYDPPAGEPGSPESPVPGANFTKLAFKKNCLPYPYSTMLLGKNPSCDLRAYTGGQSCCHHLVTLLDKDQKTPWPDTPLEYQFKWRIYYRDDPTIQNVVQHNWGGMATPTEYDVPKCADGIEGCSFENGHWVHRMNGSWTVADMVGGGKPFEPLTIHGHCHAPTCIDFTMFNADTGEVICRQRPIYGQTNATFDERGYLSVPPCVFGDAAAGLQPMMSLPPSTRLFSTKTCKADAGHHGEMSLWQTYCRQ